MTSTKLSMATIRNLLKEKVKDKDPLMVTYKERWPGDLNMVKIAKAAKRGADFVLFRDGSRFSIKYNDDNVLLKPSNGEFAPMGFFSRKQLKEALEEGIDLDATE